MQASMLDVLSQVVQQPEAGINSWDARTCIHHMVQYEKVYFSYEGKNMCSFYLSLERVVHRALNLEHQMMLV